MDAMYIPSLITNSYLH